MDVPTVVVPTARYVLRPWTDGDLPAVAEAATDPYIPTITSVPRPYSAAAGLAFIRKLADLHAAGTAVPLAIADRATDSVLGHVSLRLRDLDLGRASLGYWTLPSARGHGTAGEALAALTEWAFDTLPVSRAELYVEPWNAASKRVAERAGFVREGPLRSWQPMGGKRCDMEMFARIAER
jgi:RimJ/RimL family protein N-acetyltransferase